MNRTLEKNQIKNVQTARRSDELRAQPVSSFDEIPDFSDANAERMYWKTHCLGRDLLDQVPEIQEEEG